jgi:cardiolipin synthase (CMP-forming)
MSMPAPTVESDRRPRLLTVPNVLSLLRLASVPVFVILFATSREEAAVILYAVGAISDFLDGFIARRTHSVTELGKLLDPLADRIFIVALAVSLVAREVLPLWLALVVIARDVLVLSLFPALEGRGIERIRVNFVGKTATASLLAGLTVLAWSETTFAGSAEATPLGMAFVGVGAILYWVAGALYAREAIRKIHALRTRGSFER